MEYITEAEAFRRYDVMLDEVYSPIVMGELRWDPSRVLKQMDPSTYVAGYNDWLDSEVREEIFEIREEDEEEYGDGMCSDGCCDAMPDGV
jgi:hypothetical protein